MGFQIWFQYKKEIAAIAVVYLDIRLWWYFITLDINSLNLLGEASVYRWENGQIWEKVAEHPIASTTKLISYSLLDLYRWEFWTVLEISPYSSSCV